MAKEKSDEWIANMRRVIPDTIYSQYGEESFLGHIFNNIGVTNRHFVEFGAGDGKKLSNTRLLQERFGWIGLQIDADNHGNPEVKQEFITQENIVDLLNKYSVPKSFDLLSIDLDGNDGHILRKLLVIFSPRVIIAEYNSSLPVGEALTIKYNPNHVFENNNYHGMSFAYGERIADEFGYRVIFQNANLNMYMVRKDCLANPSATITVLNSQIVSWPVSPNREWVHY